MKPNGIIPRFVYMGGDPDADVRAQVKAAYTRFRQTVDRSIAPYHTHYGMLPGGATYQVVSNSGMDHMIVNLPPASSQLQLQLAGPGTIVAEADFLVFIYGFTLEAGTDLDTRTKLLSPGSMTNFVGWNRDSVYQVTIEGEPVDVVKWSGDNTGNGAESVLIDVQALKTAFGTTPISLIARAFWYSTRLTGNCNFRVEAYKGGTMSLSSFVFSNTGGEKLAEVAKTQNVSTETRDSSFDGDLVANVTFNPATNELTLA